VIGLAFLLLAISVDAQRVVPSRRVYAPAGLAAVLVFGTVVALAQASSLSDAQVLAAIDVGNRGHSGRLTTTCSAQPERGEAMTASRAGGIQRDGTYTVTVATAGGEIAYRAEAARRLSRPFTLDEVTDDMRAEGVAVLVEPDPPAMSKTGATTKTSVAGLIQYVQIKSKAQVAAVVQPERVDAQPVEWSTLGEVVRSNRAAARFSLAQLQQLGAGDVEIVVATHDGERRCTVSRKDLRKLLAAR
jgi:hypothetical protein